MTMINSQYGDRRLKRKIRGLRQIFEECDHERRPGKRRFAHRDYLEAVYALFAEIGAGVIGTQVARKLAEIYGIARRKNAGLIRAVIDASASNLDPKMASRWTQGLKYAWRKRQEWTRWQKFVEGNGGIAGCARALSKSKKDKQILFKHRCRRALVEAKKAAHKDGTSWSRLPTGAVA